MTSLVQFLFILLVPIVLVVGGLASLFAVGALFDALDNPQDLQRRVEGLFRQPPREPRPLSSRHYYQPHWR